MASSSEAQDSNYRLAGTRVPRWFVIYVAVRAKGDSRVSKRRQFVVSKRRRASKSGLRSGPLDWGGSSANLEVLQRRIGQRRDAT